MHSPRRSTQPLRIIIADDHEWIRQIAVQIAEQTLPHAEIIAVEDGAQALDAYRMGGCDFLVSNHKMPNLDGTGLIREVRKEQPQLPILMISIDSHAKADAFASGANWFLTKEQIMEQMPTILRENAGRRSDSAAS